MFFILSEKGYLVKEKAPLVVKREGRMARWPRGYF
jgi:hypothetical protein